MKATIIVLCVLCIVVGGIAGWATRGLFAKSAGPASIMNLTSEPDTSNSRIAVYDGGMLIVADYNPMYNGGTIEHVTKLKIK